MSESAPAAATDAWLNRARPKTTGSASTIGSRDGCRAAARPTPTSRTHARADSRHRSAAPSWLPRYGLSAARYTWPVAHAAEQEQPLVVVSAASFVEAERRFLAFAPDAHDSAAGSLAAGEWRGAGRRIAGRWSAQACRWRAGASTAAGLLRSRTSLARDSARGKDDVPLSVLGHRVLVFLAKETTLHQNVEAGWIITAAHLAHVEIDGACDLLTPEHEFGFLFALRLSAPNRHRDAHHDHHDADADQQCGHRVSALAALTTR
jgi:hypothetical protein